MAEANVVPTPIAKNAPAKRLNPPSVGCGVAEEVGCCGGEGVGEGLGVAVFTANTMVSDFPMFPAVSLAYTTNVWAPSENPVNVKFPYAVTSV